MADPRRNNNYNHFNKRRANVYGQQQNTQGNRFQQQQAGGAGGYAQWKTNNNFQRHGQQQQQQQQQSNNYYRSNNNDANKHGGKGHWQKFKNNDDSGFYSPQTDNAAFAAKPNKYQQLVQQQQQQQPAVRAQKRKLQLEVGQPVKKQKICTKATDAVDFELPDDGQVIDTSWDINYYHASHETEDTWELKRRFMEAYKHKIPEHRLVCLAQVFANVELLGCRYPAETMQFVNQLSVHIAEDYRKAQKSRLKRTFVQASDAAQQRAKGRRSTQQSTTAEQQRKRDRPCFGDGQQVSPHIDLFANLPYGKFVLLLRGGRNCIQQSAQRCGMQMLEREAIGTNQEQKKMEIYIDDKLIASACESTLKASKHAVFTQALSLLQRNCYSIQQNPHRDTIKISKSNNQVVCGVSKQEPDNSEEKKLDANNKGFKMMKMMGWTGGGLGSQAQGKEEPVSYLLKNNRAGLGNNAAKIDRNYFTQILSNYINSPDIRELTFESSFTKEERALLHEIANRFNLRSSSYGNGEERHLVISKKNITNEQILEEILINKNSTYCDQYIVQVPESKAELYPDHTACLELKM